METVNVRVTYETIVAETGEIKHRNRNFKDIPSKMTKDEVKLFARLFCYVNKLKFVKINITIEMTESEEEKELFKNAPNLLNFEHLFPFLNEKQSAPVKQEEKSTVRKTNKKQNKTTAATNQDSISPVTPPKDSHLSKETVASLDETKVEMSQPKQESILKEKIVIQKPKSSSIHKNGSKSAKKKKSTSLLKISEIIDRDEELEVDEEEFDESILERLGDKDYVSFVDEKMVNGEMKRTHYDIRNIDLS